MKFLYLNFDFSISILIKNGLFSKVVDSSGKEWEISAWNSSWIAKPIVIVIPK